MTPRPKAAYPKNVVLTLRISESMLADLNAIYEKHGVAIAEQVRRGMRDWIKKMERKRAGTRTRA
jgi:hypothetical protein